MKVAHLNGQNIDSLLEKDKIILPFYNHGRTPWRYYSFYPLNDTTFEFILSA